MQTTSRLPRTAVPPMLRLATARWLIPAIALSVSGWSAPRRAAAVAPSTVLLVHGIWSDPTVWDSARADLGQAGYATAVIDFRKAAGSSAAAIADQGKALGRKIASLLSNDPDRTVDLVCHSMGGLAARWYLEHPALWPRGTDGEPHAGVGKLIMLGTPNQGTDVFLADPVGAIIVARAATGAAGRDRVRKWSPGVRDLFGEWMPPPVQDSAGLFSYDGVAPALLRWPPEPTNGFPYRSPIDDSSLETAQNILRSPFAARLLSPAGVEQVRLAVKMFPDEARRRFQKHRAYYRGQAGKLGPVFSPPVPAPKDSINTRRISRVLQELNVSSSNPAGARVYLLAGAASSRVLADTTVAGVRVKLVSPYSTRPSDTIVPADSALGIDAITGAELFPGAPAVTVDAQHTGLPGSLAARRQMLDWLAQ